MWCGDGELRVAVVPAAAGFAAADDDDPAAAAAARPFAEPERFEPERFAHLALRLQQFACAAAAPSWLASTTSPAKASTSSASPCGTRRRGRPPPPASRWLVVKSFESKQRDQRESKTMNYERAAPLCSSRRVQRDKREQEGRGPRPRGEHRDLRSLLIYQLIHFPFPFPFPFPFVFFPFPFPLLAAAAAAAAAPAAFPKNELIFPFCFLAYLSSKTATLNLRLHPL